MEPIDWLNGWETAAVSPANRGLAYGDGLFETIAIVRGRARLLPVHLERLAQGCERLGIGLSRACLELEIAQALARADNGVLKIIVTRGGAGRGYHAVPGAAGDRILRWLPSAEAPIFTMREPVRARLCRQRISLQPRLAGLKHLNRLEQVMARAEWRDPAIAEGLMLDTNGHLIEGVSSNLFLLKDRCLRTARLDQCGVAGVMRRFVIDRVAAAAGLRVEECHLTLADLYASEELFLSNSLTGLTPVDRVDCFRLPGTARARQLQQMLIDWQEAGHG